MLKVGDKVVVTKVMQDVFLDGVEVGKVGEISRVDCSDGTDLPYLVDFGEATWWAGLQFLVEKAEDVGDSVIPTEGEITGYHGTLVDDTVLDSVIPTEGENTGAKNHLNSNGMMVRGGQEGTVEEFIDVENQVPKVSDNTSEEGVYNTIIKRDGFTIYTNHHVEIEGDLIRVGGARSSSMEPVLNQ